MTNFLIFDLTSNNVLKHLGEYGEADLLTPDKHFNIITLLCRNAMMRTCYVDITYKYMYPYLAQLGSHH